MDTVRRSNILRHANAKPLIFAVGLAYACVSAGALAEQRCDHLNYDENKVGDYTVPDPLLSKEGKRITDRAAWPKRRGDILQDFRDLMYGHTPELPITLRAKVVAIRKDAVDGLATRRLHGHSVAMSTTMRGGESKNATSKSRTASRPIAHAVMPSKFSIWRTCRMCETLVGTKSVAPA